MSVLPAVECCPIYQFDNVSLISGSETEMFYRLGLMREVATPGKITPKEPVKLDVAGPRSTDKQWKTTGKWQKHKEAMNKLNTPKLNAAKSKHENKPQNRELKTEKHWPC